MLKDFERRLSTCTTQDRSALQRRAQRLQHRSQGNGEDPRWRQLERAVARAQALYQRRVAGVPKTDLPANLPITGSAQEIVASIQKHQVLIVSGDTGSGKSTQLPKLCLQAGRGIDGQIAHTQPRRMAARNVARRVAQELNQSVGDSVGFKVRFDARISSESYIKVLTDGLLLAELGQDKHLLAYDTIIVDEAHERSLNIDFLLGYLKRLCARRPELRIVISSATLDEERLSGFFDDAPVIRVSGRSYPVQVRYREPSGDEALAEQVRASVVELCKHGPGDVLVFLSGEREIHEVAGRLRHTFGTSLDVMPLYARLPLAQQDQVFAAHRQRRIVLATNVAETSLTIPGVRYVIDAGQARVGRYAPGSAVQRLPIENISKASARQRSGRCGREGPGICIRLYSEQMYEAFADFTEPEILRTDLAAVLLRMHSLGVRDLNQFPLLDAPKRRHVNDGLRLLRELGAIGEDSNLTTLGRQLARLPLDPRVGRMLLAAGEHECVREVLMIASGLAAGDPRERAAGQRGPQPQQLRFEDDRSDFLRLVNIWQYVHQQLKLGHSLSQLCRRCRLSYPRMQEWREIHLQLRISAREMGLQARREPASYASIHRALLTGLLRHVGQRANERDYQGIRGNVFRVAGSSGQSGRRVRWVLVAELVDTGSAFAHTVAAVRPEWIEQAAGKLIRRSHFDAWWDARRAQAMIFEQTALYSLTVTARRKIRFANISHQGAREVFIRGALVEGRYRSDAPFVQKAWQWINLHRELEAKLRRPDPAIHHERLYQFFEDRLPDSVCDAATFEAWWPNASEKERRSLSTAALEATRHHGAQTIDDPHTRKTLFPNEISLPNLSLPVHYAFAPGEEHDGITLKIPREFLASINEVDVEKSVPGLLRDRVLAMLRSLPKSMRRRVGPAGDALQRFLASPRDADLALPLSLQRFLSMQCAVEIDAQYWSRTDIQTRIPAHLRVRYQISDDAGKILASSRDLQRLQQRHSNLRSAMLERREVARELATHWQFAELPQRYEVKRADASGWVFPALFAEVDGVAVQRFDDIDRARRSHARGLLRLAIAVRDLDIQHLMRQVPHADQLCLMNLLVSLNDVEIPQVDGAILELKPGQGPCAELIHSVVMVALEQAFESDDLWLVRDANAFAAYCERGEPRIESFLEQQSQQVFDILQAHRQVLNALDADWPSAYADNLRDVRDQVAALVRLGFVTSTPVAYRSHLLRYLQGALLRLDKLRRGGSRDSDKMLQLAPALSRFLARAKAHVREGRRDSALNEYRWLLEEYRISLFAQELGTQQRVSRERLDRLWQRIPP